MMPKDVHETEGKKKPFPKLFQFATGLVYAVNHVQHCARQKTNIFQMVLCWDTADWLCSGNQEVCWLMLVCLK